MIGDTINDAATFATGMYGGALGRIDKYELLRELGEGGFGAVYLARDTVAGLEVAVKGLPPEVKHNEGELEGIRANFALVKRLRHPNIVAVTDLHPARLVAYASKEVESKLRVFPLDTMVVMDYAPGVTLAKWRRQFPGGAVPLDKALVVVRQIAAALDFAHKQRVLHRDVKPANVMVETSDDGRLTARVLDFGLAAEIRSSMGRVSREIRDMCGTRSYMAPEQWLGRKQGPATDQYALAVLFYELVVGDVPFASVFDCGDPAVMRLAVTTDEPDIPANLKKSVRRALAVALAKKPEERFASCGDFVDALEGKANVSRGGAEPRRGGGAGKAIAVLALLAALGAGGYYGWVKHEEALREKADSTNEAASIATNGGMKQPELKRPATKDDGNENAMPSQPNPPDPTEDQVVEIKVEAYVANGRLNRISDDDGFRRQKNMLADDFERANGFYVASQWSRAAVGYTNFVKACMSLESLSEARDEAKSSRAAARRAKMLAKDAGAELHALDRWKQAEDLITSAEGLLCGMSFAPAKDKFELALKQFNLSADEAERERERLDAERKRQELVEAAERERRKNWRVEGQEFTISSSANSYLGMTMKWCPKGSFTMGSPVREEGRDGDEVQHQVTLTKGFWLGETEVTQGQWKKLMDGETVVDLAKKGLQDDTLYNFSSGKKTLRDFWEVDKYSDPKNKCGDLKDEVPVYNVSWHEAVEFCRRLTKKERAEGRIPDGYEYRLPTEAEWEYACRAGTTTALPSNRGIRILGKYNAPALSDIAWYGGNSSVGFEGRGVDTSDWKDKEYPGGWACAREVKGKKPNNWGLYDMLGNVWEWCGDYYGNYPIGAAVDPDNTTSGAYRVYRGGSWFTVARSCRSADRNMDVPGFRGGTLGFRVALAPQDRANEKNALRLM